MNPSTLQPPPRTADASRAARATQTPESLRNYLTSKYDVVEIEFRVAGTTFSLLKVRDTNALVDAINPQTFADDERLPYWADVWTSSLELARWCLEEADMRGKRVLELGCGLGLVGIAAAHAGAIVTLSDYEQDALNFSRHNLMRNLSEEILSTNCNVIQLDWRHPPPLEPFDLILAADVVYERRMFAPLIDLLRRLLAPDGYAVVTEPGRSIGESFFALIQEEGFHLTTTACRTRLNGKTSRVVRATIKPLHSNTANAR